VGKFIKYLSFAAILSIVPLQVIWLFTNYKSYEKSLYYDFELCLRESLDIELTNRINSMKGHDALAIGVSDDERVVSTDDYSVYNDFVSKEYHRPIVLENVKKILEEKLHSRGVDKPLIKLGIFSTDSSLYAKKINYFANKNAGFAKKFYSQIIPLYADYSYGVQAVFHNPYYVVIRKMFWLLLFSMIVMLFVIICLILQIRIIIKQSVISKMRQDHTYAIVHDMKTPLTAIMLAGKTMNILYDNNKIPPKHYLDNICNESENLKRQCDKILTIAKLNSKKIAFNFSEVNVFNLFLEIADKYSFIKIKKILFEYDVKAVKVITDIDYLSEMIINLIDNSIKYSGESVKIILASCQNANNIEISVTDNGLGIPHDKKCVLYKQFERGDNATGKSGYGLGLHYVYIVMKALGGSMKIESELKKYTKIILAFPQRKAYNPHP
jgi:two-component system, OmpR family, phosphate regulon sensor histidine kinase PhoR